MWVCVCVMFACCCLCELFVSSQIQPPTRLYSLPVPPPPPDTHTRPTEIQKKKNIHKLCKTLTRLSFLPEIIVIIIKQVFMFVFFIFWLCKIIFSLAKKSRFFGWKVFQVCSRSYNKTFKNSNLLLLCPPKRYLCSRVSFWPKCVKPSSGEL